HCSSASTINAAAPSSVDAGGGGALNAPPGGLALRVDEARQARGFAAAARFVQLSVTLANGAGGKPVPFNPLLFALKTVDGILHAPSIVPLKDGEQWVTGKTPNVADQLAGGATYSGWVVTFDVDAAQSVPVEIAFSNPADDRTATAPVTLE